MQITFSPYRRVINIQFGKLENTDMPKEENLNHHNPVPRDNHDECFEIIFLPGKYVLFIFLKKWGTIGDH